MRMALMSASTVAPLKYDSSPTSPDTRGRTLIGFAQVLGRQPPRTMRTHQGLLHRHVLLGAALR